MTNQNDFDPSDRLQQLKPGRNWAAFMLLAAVVLLVGGWIYFSLTLPVLKFEAKMQERQFAVALAEASECTPALTATQCRVGRYKDYGLKKCLSLKEGTKYGQWGPCLNITLTEAQKKQGLCVEQSRGACGTDVGMCVSGRKTCLLVEGGSYLLGKWGPCKGVIGPKAEKCDAFDNDCDGKIDNGLKGCDTKALLAMRGENCTNGLDDDADGDVDCNDLDCVGLVTCSPFEVCTDGIDNDGDGLADCYDPDCSNRSYCNLFENCTNGLDDDGDGLIDCLDVDCNTHVVCQIPLEVCNDGVDNDGDGMVDCKDADCHMFKACRGYMITGLPCIVDFKKGNCRKGIWTSPNAKGEQECIPRDPKCRN